MCRKWQFNFVIFILQTCKLCLIMKNNYILIEGLLKTVKVIENKESLRNCHNPKKPKKL